MRTAVRGEPPGDDVTDFPRCRAYAGSWCCAPTASATTSWPQPALAALRAAYPDAAITLVTSPPVVALLRRAPGAGGRGARRPAGRPACAASRDRTARRTTRRRSSRSSARRMRERRFDLGVQLHGGGGNANPLLVRFGARITAGSRAPGGGPAGPDGAVDAYQHDLLRWLEVVARWSVPAAGSTCVRGWR